MFRFQYKTILWVKLYLCYKTTFEFGNFQKVASVLFISKERHCPRSALRDILKHLVWSKSTL